MRKFLVLIVLCAATVGLAGSAAADSVGPTDSTFVGGNVICGNDPGNFIQGPPISAYSGEQGLEVCIDGSGSNPGLRVFIANDFPYGDLPGVSEIHGDIDKDTPLLGPSGHFLFIDLPF